MHIDTLYKLKNEINILELHRENNFCVSLLKILNIYLQNLKL